MKNLPSIVIALALLGAGAYRQWQTASPSTPAPVAPSGYSAEAMALRDVLSKASPQDRAALGDLYAALADAVERRKVIDTTEQLMRGTSNAIDLAFGGKQLVPGVDVGASVDAVVAAALGGTPNVPLTDELRVKACRGLRDVAWACGR